MKKIILGSVIVISIFFLLEIILILNNYIFLQNDNIKTFTQYRIYDTGKTFKNYNNFFTYYPKIKKRVLKAFVNKNAKNLDDIIITNDYFIQTNNSGLLMKKEISIENEHVLIIGDSLTEGEGYEPWFYELEKNYTHYQLINLGILGTGPINWHNMINHFVNKKEIFPEAMIINIILNDFYRGNLIFSDTELNCLEKELCNYRGSFQGFNLAANESQKSIKKLIFKRISSPLGEISGNQFTFDYLKKSQLLSTIKSLIFQKYIIKENFKYLERIHKLVKDDKIFYNIITYEESSNHEAYLKTYNKLISFLNNKNIDYQICPLQDYYFDSLDSHHPNRDGYKKITKCNSKLLDKLKTF